MGSLIYAGEWLDLSLMATALSVPAGVLRTACAGCGGEGVPRVAGIDPVYSRMDQASIKDGPGQYRDRASIMGPGLILLIWSHFSARPRFSENRE